MIIYSDNELIPCPVYGCDAEAHHYHYAPWAPIAHKPHPILGWVSSCETTADTVTQCFGPPAAPTAPTAPDTVEQIIEQDVAHDVADARGPEVWRAISHEQFLTSGVPEDSIGYAIVTRRDDDGTLVPTYWDIYEST